MEEWPHRACTAFGGNSRPPSTFRLMHHKEAIVAAKFCHLDELARRGHSTEPEKSKRKRKSRRLWDRPACRRVNMNSDVKVGLCMAVRIWMITLAVTLPALAAYGI